MVPVVLNLLEAGIAPSTRRVYWSGQERYRKFCGEAGLTAFPASERNLMLFVAQLHQGGLAHGTMKSYLAAVRHAHISRGLGDPGLSAMPQLEYLLKGVKRLAPSGTRRRLPITPEILDKLKAFWLGGTEDRDKLMLWAASCLCFFGFLRSGEAVSPSVSSFDPETHLCYEDVRVDSRSSPSFCKSS